LKKQSVKVKKAGRPPKAEGEGLDSIIPATRCKASERAAFEIAAKKEGLALSEWIRQTLNKGIKK
jgi:predicted HicB family RNase H-like nuclease